MSPWAGWLHCFRSDSNSSLLTHPAPAAGNGFFKNLPFVAPLRGALAVWGLGVDDIGVRQTAAPLSERQAAFPALKTVPFAAFPALKTVPFAAFPALKTVPFAGDRPTNESP